MLFRSYNLPLWLFRDKTLKQTLNLTCELGIVVKTHSHLTLETEKLLKHKNKFFLKKKKHKMIIVSRNLEMHME